MLNSHHLRHYLFIENVTQKRNLAMFMLTNIGDWY